MVVMMTKFPLCADSLFIILLGGTLMAIFGITIFGIRAKAQQRLSDLGYFLEILTVMPILCWRICVSCQELEEIQDTIRKFEETDLVDSRATIVTAEDFRELIDGYMHNDKWVDMSTPRGCSYNQHRCHKETKMPLGEEVSPVKTSNGATYRPTPVEMRGITLRQLRAIDAIIEARCEKDGWVSAFDGTPITPDTVNLFEINKYIILPFTKNSRASFVETLPSTAGTQPPQIFISHWWGMPLKNTLDVIAQIIFDFRWNHSKEDEIRGGGMSEDTPIWICAFANNQWKIDECLDLDSSGFLKAIDVSKYRIVTIFDAKLAVFDRIWCVYEIFLTLMNPNGLWAVYTPHNYSVQSYRKQRDAIGIVLGGAPGEAADDTYIREESFPRDLIVKAFNLQLEYARSAVDSDKMYILKCMSNYMSNNEENLEANPSTVHDAFKMLNNAVKGAFAASVPALKAALAAISKDEWKKTLTIMSKGIQTNTFTLDFSAFDPPLASKQAYDLISHVPVTCTGLLLTNAIGETMVGVSRGVIEWVVKAKKVKEIIFFNCRVGDDEKGQMIGSQLVNGLTNSNCTETLEDFYMTNTDLIIPGNISDLAPLVFKKMKKMKLFYITDESNRSLITLSKGRHTQAFRVDFSAYDDHPLSSKQAYDLISQIPITCTHLRLSNAVDSETTIGVVRGMVEWLRNAREVKELIFADCNVGDDEDGSVVGSELANELMECSCTSAIEYFRVRNTDMIVSGNVSKWASALRQMKNLMEFKCLGNDGGSLSDDDVNILINAARESGAFACFNE